MLEAARQENVTKIVYSSSAGIFGELKTLPIREDHPVEPDTPYGCTKLAGEKLCLSYAKLYSMSAVCLRYFNVYGPMQRYDAYGNVIPIFVHQLLRGDSLTVFGDGEQTRDFVNVADVAQANLQAARARKVTGAFNIGSGTRVTINELVRLIEGASGIRPSFVMRRRGMATSATAWRTSQRRVRPWSFNRRSTSPPVSPNTSHGLVKSRAFDWIGAARGRRQPGASHRVRGRPRDH